MNHKFLIYRKVKSENMENNASRGFCPEPQIYNLSYDNLMELHVCGAHAHILSLSFSYASISFSSRKWVDPVLSWPCLAIFFNLVLIAILSSVRAIPCPRGHLPHGHCITAPQGRARKLAITLSWPGSSLSPAMGE